MKIRVFITGGTIDGMVNESYPPEEKYTFVPGLLEGLNGEFLIDILMIKDSSLLTDADREAIVESCKNSPEDHILITHGTDTMARTAKLLDSLDLGKTIVLTGAFTPANKEDSDAQANVRAALHALHTNPAGVYIATGDKIFNASNVRKNFEKKIFEEET